MKTEVFTFNCLPCLVILTRPVSLILHFLLHRLPAKGNLLPNNGGNNDANKKDFVEPQQLFSDTDEGASKKSDEEETETISLPKDNFEIPATDNLNKPADKPAETCESLKCNQCFHEANCKVSLRKHIMREHKKPVIDERFKCDVCRENQ